MLVRLMYASRSKMPAQTMSAELHAILRLSRAHNAAAGITGVLCFSGGIFLQVLEGGRPVVNALYARIANDQRHCDVELLSYEEIDERSFAGWFMGEVDLRRINPALLMKYSEKAALDPYAMSGQASMALCRELVATASVSCMT